MSKAELRAIFNKTQGPNTWTAVVNRQINAYGKEAAVLHERPDSDDPKRLAITEQAAEYVYRRLNKGPWTEEGNPFVELTQHQLSAIVYDESGTFTDIERYAAGYLRDDRNQAVLEKIGALIYHPDPRLLYRAQLDPSQQHVDRDGVQITAASSSFRRISAKKRSAGNGCPSR